MKVRRVVTGHDADGKAVVASDTEIDGFRPAMITGSEFHNLWGADQAPHFPDDGSMSPFTAYFPPIGGFRFGFFTVPPETQAVAAPPVDVDAAVAEFDAGMPGLVSYMEPDAPGMHTTDTIDFEVVVDGEVWLELDNGVEVHLKPGDTVVQNGTRHAWRNHGDKPCRLAVFLIGAHHDTVKRPAQPGLG
jgi:mannose-6-phosphate isomerase-like protein (cupin superfamily)